MSVLDPWPEGGTHTDNEILKINSIRVLSTGGNTVVVHSICSQAVEAQ